MENREYEMVAYEGFIKRASRINYPFMLKGSYVTRQYFSNPNDRMPADLDWVYLEKIDEESIAKQTFDEWLIHITELGISDGVQFRSFKENQFWRMIDYAMADDFPTINTDLKCWVDGIELDFRLDISFNLNIEYPPIPLTYKPLRGESFIVPKTVPICLQVAWKIHQTLVRPRFKDLFDLIHLVQHRTFDDNALNSTLKALLNECIADNVTMDKLHSFFSYNFEKLFYKHSMNKTWEYWRHNKRKQELSCYDKAEDITNTHKLPTRLSDFLEQFKQIMEIIGLDLNAFNKLVKMSTADKII